MNFQVTVLKILVSYSDGFAVMADLKCDMAFLATSGPDWADRTKRLGAHVRDLDIFSQKLVERLNGGWPITSKGSSGLHGEPLAPSRPFGAEEALPKSTAPSGPLLKLPEQRAARRNERHKRRRAARERIAGVIRQG
ncbi:hypothetical protein [Bradyrhizobium yuanmingense]|uniref:hypothetical protein n=1 Tax=Bradyrhizobium yuanmingense TaxID=108015 RepID=UPI0023B8EB4E|nr:hypothetical protein [Bradyrhizobium yuanmingense]MDF0498850.1 hypothetical protein [Bradyrhizobium yuanmingense]